MDYTIQERISAIGAVFWKWKMSQSYGSNCQWNSSRINQIILVRDYKRQNAQELTEDDSDRRPDFCEIMINYIDW